MEKKPLWRKQWRISTTFVVYLTWIHVVPLARPNNDMTLNPGLFHLYSGSSSQIAILYLWAMTPDRLKLYQEIQYSGRPNYIKYLSKHQNYARLQVNILPRFLYLVDYVKHRFFFQIHEILKYAFVKYAVAIWRKDAKLIWNIRFPLPYKPGSFAFLKVCIYLWYVGITMRSSDQIY